TCALPIATDDDADGEVDDVALHDEVLETLHGVILGGGRDEGSGTAVRSVRDFNRSPSPRQPPSREREPLLPPCCARSSRGPRPCPPRCRPAPRCRPGRGRPRARAPGPPSPRGT